MFIKNNYAKKENKICMQKQIFNLKLTEASRNKI